VSLKAFHVVFIASAILCLGGFAAWGFHDFAGSGNLISAGMGAGSAGGAIALLVYSRWFLKKLRHVSYL